MTFFLINFVDTHNKEHLLKFKYEGRGSPFSFLKHILLKRRFLERKKKQLNSILVSYIKDISAGEVVCTQ